VANRLSFSIIVAALVVGSALVLAGGAELVLRIPFVNLNLPLAQIGFVMAALMGAWLVLSIIRSRGL
jgi:ubiquinone biosynthesis protein